MDSRNTRLASGLQEWLNLPPTDARVDNWPLMQSPVLIFSIIAFYVLLMGRVGRWLMESTFLARYSFEKLLKPIIVVYNVAMVWTNFYIAYTIFDADRTLQYDWTCEPPHDSRTDYQSMRVARACHLFCLSKLIELMDTVFIIALRKWRQLTFLHVFHHSSMLANGWMIARFAPSSNPAHSVMVNSTVHVLMYSYYALTSFASLVQTQRLQAVLYHGKKYLTLAQLIQFFIGLTLGTIAIVVRRCQHYSTTSKVVGMTYVSSMVVLFGNFYYQQYIRVRKPKEALLKKPVHVLSAVEPKTDDHTAQNGTVRKRHHHVVKFVVVEESDTTTSGKAA